MVMVSPSAMLTTLPVMTWERVGVENSKEKSRKVGNSRFIISKSQRIIVCEYFVSVS